MKRNEKRTGFPLTINGITHFVEKVEPGQTLLDYVRSIGLTGAKEGCKEGECGACALLWVEEKEGKSCLRAINSCLIPIVAAAHREIYTVEVLAEGDRLCDAQRVMVEEGGSQCGYCTPGFVVTLFAEQSDRKEGKVDLGSLSGNLCRCTGYRPIKDAALRLHSLKSDHPLFKRLSNPPPRLEKVLFESGPERFLRPTTLDELWELFHLYPEARWAAGMTDLSVERNILFRRFPCLISLEGITKLRIFSESSRGIEIGAGLSLREIEERLRTIPNPPPGFAEWFPLFASPLIRNRATLGGNLATASPVGDSAPLLLVLQARLLILSPKGSREIPLEKFFLGYRKTILQPGEVIVSVWIPKPYPSIVRFYKVAKRQSDDIATVSMAAAVDLDPDGFIQSIRLAFGGVAEKPIRVEPVEQELIGKPWELPVIRQAKLKLNDSLSPIDDHRGSRSYRVALTQNLLEKFYWQTPILPHKTSFG
ncbi:xanthine dehydrogenase small subunit [Candidatus Methylacidiphilum infernorum]|uniref:Xanthine dehydrogenase, iron-sulfur cluster and FAD-binding subunit A n=1 Tax=Methylacidiphilum infernorum (isolate V4) TaxID=481448 RepID=B3E0G5_METI4|nr:FAD binding domain-containing protein [Candidatus Methylacidiphilum infernorum]ACD84394.1 Xanthine dehydrogenase, iron-sulfur cluster and FAD-binding subunit A [Methylacidiphilum infernorum V4]